MIGETQNMKLKNKFNEVVYELDTNSIKVLLQQAITDKINLTNLVLEHQDLSGLNLSNLDLSGSIFLGANLFNTDLSNSDISNCGFFWC